MTFSEAAIEVLYRAGRPLHYKKITEAAIQEELLSHVGRTPEKTMGDRLTKEAQKKQGASVKRIRPGVYQLRKDVEKKLEKEGKKREPLGKKKPKPKAKKSSRSKGSSNGSQRRSKKSDGDNSSRRRRRRSRGKKSRDDDSRSDQNSKSRRGSKKRRRRSSKDNNKRSRSKSSKAKRRSKSDDKDRSNRRRKRRRRRSKSRDDSSNKSNRKSRSRRSKSKDRSTSSKATRKPEKPARHLDEGPVRIDAIARAAHTVLEDNKRRPMKIDDLADEIFNRKLVRFHTHDASATVQSAMAGDNQLRKRRGHRPLFIQYDRNRWGLTKWGLSKTSVEREQSILSLAEEIRQDAVDTLGDALTDIKPEAVESLALTLLERLDYRDIKVSKRSSDGDVFFTSDWRQGLADVRVCIQVVGDCELTLSDDVVTELRGTLHHYSASEGVIIHLGDIDDDAVEESREEKLAPITLIDRDTFVELLIKHGIGVRTYQTPVTMVDTAFLDSLASV